MATLEDLCIAAYLATVCRAAAALRAPRAPAAAAEGIARLRQAVRTSLAESLGGVSSLNVRSKMLARVRDVPFLVRVGQPYLRRSPLPALATAVNQVTKVNVDLSPGLTVNPFLAISAKGTVRKLL